MRFKVISPVPGGYAFWNVIDTEDPALSNFAVATFYKGFPFAKAMAETACRLLNDKANEYKGL